MPFGAAHTYIAHIREYPSPWVLYSRKNFTDAGQRVDTVSTKYREYRSPFTPITNALKVTTVAGTHTRISSKYCVKQYLTSGASSRNVLGPRPHVSGYFWIRNFFFPDTASVHTHPTNSAANPDIFATCGRTNFWIRKEKFADSKILRIRVDGASVF